MNMKFTRTLLMLALTAVIGLSVTGGTIAWFTDSVSSSTNVIQSGNLKIDLELKDGDNWISLDEKPDTPVFNYNLWEPGYTSMKTLKIVNEGNLALKYELRVNPLTSEIKSSNGNSLADVIDVYMAFGAQDTTSRPDFTDESTWWKCGTLSEMIAKPEGFTQGALLPTDANEPNGLLQTGVGRGELTCSIALKMQESADNEYQGLTLGNVTFTLNATQYTYEADSFNNQYDAGVEFENVDQPNGQPSDLPVATAKKLEGDNLKRQYNRVTDWENLNDTINNPMEDITLTAGYKFVANETADEAKNNPYWYYNADFVVTSNKDIQPGVIGLAGEYNYDGLDLKIAFDLDENLLKLIDEEADVYAGGKSFRLLENIAPINYHEVCKNVGEFVCGIYLCDGITDAQKEALKGTTLTVQLRLYETQAPAPNDEGELCASPNEVENGKNFEIATYTYTF